ncbi:MAG: hypothetical protein ABIE81_03725 [Candidatus Omnitrophota bacterium]
MSKELRLEIAGIGFLFRYNNCQIKEGRYSPAYLEDFIRPGNNSDFIIDLDVGFLPAIPRGRLLFESKENWRSFAHNGSFLIETYYGKSEITRVCVINKDLSKAKVYISPWTDEFDKKKRLKNNPPKNWSLETFFSVLGQLILINLLHKYQGLLLHACGVVVDGAGLVFPGISGAGKTTLARLWQKRDGIGLLSDDRVIIRKINKEYFVSGSPWPGEARIASCESAPLRKILFLSKANQNKLKALGKRESLYLLMRQCFPPIWDRQAIDFFLKFCESLVQDVPCFSFGFVPDESAVGFILKNH